MTKDFTAINTGKQDTGTDEGAVYAAIERGRQNYREQPTASREEQARRIAEGKTQGRKGCHAPRINLAMPLDNYEFVRIMSRATGRTMTGFVNYCIDHYKIQHQEFYREAQDFIERLEADDGPADEPATGAETGTDESESDQ